MSTELEDVLWPDGTVNQGGTKSALYIIPTSALSAMPAIADNKTTLAAWSTATGNFTFKGAQKAIKLYITPETGKMMAEGVGEIDGKSYLNKFAGFHPGGTAKASGLCAYLNNLSFVVVMETKDGQKRIMGGIDDPIKLTTNTWDTTEDPAGRKGFALEGEGYSAYGPMIWDGDISTIWSEASSSGS